MATSTSSCGPHQSAWRRVTHSRRFRCTAGCRMPDAPLARARTQNYDRVVQDLLAAGQVSV